MMPGRAATTDFIDASAGIPVTVTARHRSAYPPLHHLEAEIHQAGVLCARARGKFMAIEHESGAKPALPQ